MSKAQFMAEQLQPGEIYAGLLLGADGAPDQHIFLLPGAVEETTWPDAVTWAQSIGGELPTRREQALLFANLKGEFKQAWYWSGEQHEALADYAWFQYFGYGGQGNYLKSYSGRSRAVGRLDI